MDRTRALSIVVAGLLLGGACRQQAVERREPREIPMRIVSMAPSLTETLFALGVGDRVVGRTRYCSFPSEVEQIAEIGGHLDPNIEAIVALRPDLVVTIPSSEEAELRLRSLGISVLPVDQHDVAGVLQSVAVLADVCGVPQRGAALRGTLEQKLEKVRQAVHGRPRPRAVVVVGRELGEGAVRSVWAAGPETFYDDVLSIAGGANAVTGGLVPYPEISREGLVVLDPDVILDVVAGLDQRGLDAEAVRADWADLGELRAVQDGRVYVLAGDAMVVPGPRLPELVDAVANALHPGLALEGR